MNTTLIVGTRIVVLALLFYSIAIITEQRKRLVTNFILGTLTIGLLLDIAATVLMIVGSPNSPFTIHGLLGYSALTVMLIDTSLIWRFRLTNDSGSKVTKGLHVYSRYAYSWWVIAFISGSLLVFLK
jgi:hypothetical protein